jgi:hypothetical protein
VPDPREQSHRTLQVSSPAFQFTEETRAGGGTLKIGWRLAAGEWREAGDRGRREAGSG